MKFFIIFALKVVTINWVLDMKSKIGISLALGYIILLFVAAGIVFKSVDENIKLNIEEFFWNAISKECNGRLTKLNAFVIRGIGLPDILNKSRGSGVSIKSSEGEVFVPYNELNKRPEKFYRVINMDQTYLAIESPIQIEQLDSFFQKELEENQIKTKTFLYFRDNKNNREGWSCPYTPSLFPDKDICLDSIEVGVQKELFLKAYIHYPYMFVAGKVSKKIFPYVTFPLAAIILLIGVYYNIHYFWLKRNRKELMFEPVLPNGNLPTENASSNEDESNSICEYVEPPKKPRNDICWDEKTMTFYYYEHQVPLSRQNYHLLTLFLSKPDGVLTKEEIVKALWGNLHDAQTRLIKCMQRFRSQFDGIPEIEVVTGKMNYYQFIMHVRSDETQSDDTPTTSEELLHPTDPVSDNVPEAGQTSGVDKVPESATTPDSDTTPASGSVSDAKNSSPEDTNGSRL